MGAELKNVAGTKGSYQDALAVGMSLGSIWVSYKRKPEFQQGLQHPKPWARPLVKRQSPSSSIHSHKSPSFSDSECYHEHCIICAQDKYNTKLTKN